MATLFDLQAVIRLDSDQFENGVKKAEKSGSSLATSLKSGLATAAKVGAAAVGAAATAIGALTTAAVNNYAEYEQLVGGVETLFKNSADTVMGYAENAYKTAGLSANEYMETVTSFSASLLQSLDGDTKAAASAADMAITDMADNANKMGTSMEMIQNAYQGFAKQNYTMLDNLKLGYGGTKEEMERLLADAEKLSGQEYDISSYADIVDAIHVVQTEMGITGTTAKEAATTIQGSTASMKSAWANLVTGLADDNADFDTLMSNFVDSVVTVGENIIPRIQTTIQGVTQLVSAASTTIVPLIVDTLMQNLPALLTAGVDLVFALVNGMLDNIDTVIDSVLQLIDVIVDKLIENLPKLVEGGVRLIIALAGGLIKAIPKLLAAVPKIVGAVVIGIANSLAPVVQAGRDFVEKVKDGFMEKVKAAKEWGKDLISNFIDGLLAKWNKLKSTVSDIAGSIADFIGFSEPEKGPLSNFHTYAPDMMDLFAQGIRENERVVTDQIQKSFNFRNSIVDGMDFVASYTPSISTAKANRASSAAAQNNTDTLLTAILNKLDGMGVYLDGTTLTGYIDSSLGRKTEQNKRLALA